MVFMRYGKKNHGGVALLHVMLAGYAAQVRTTLGLFFLANFFFLVHIGNIGRATITNSQKKMIFLMPFFASFINGQGARMRLFAEPLIVVVSVKYLFAQGPEYIAS